MQLVEQGKLDLDRDVNDYLDFKIPDRGDGPITLRNIMTHTAGFEEQVKSLITEDPKALVPLQQYVEDLNADAHLQGGLHPRLLQLRDRPRRLPGRARLGADVR